jgi:hypothetical protein
MRTTGNVTPSMRLLPRLHGFVAAALVMIAVVAVLGHVCVLPGHAHAVPVEGHGTPDEAPADNAVHRASCDALKSTSPTPSVVRAATWTALIVVEPVSVRLVDAVSAVVQAESPPLFLLHAAFLI